MHSKELFLTFCVLLCINFSVEMCTSRFNINVAEGEPFYLKYCSYNSEHKNKSDAIKWYKSNKSLGQIELNPNSSPRIVFNGYALEFWPVELDDNGSYIFNMGNDEHKWKLNVISKNKHNCFAENTVFGKNIKVNKILKIKCENNYYSKWIERTSIYKNCEQQIKEINGSTTSHEKNAEFKDQGYYTCVFSLHYKGKLFNLTKTYNITVSEGNNYINPVIFGPHFNHIPVELGKDEELNCSAVLNEKDIIYWSIFNKNGTKHPNVYEGNETKFMTPDGKYYASKVLYIKNVNEDNLNFPYNCTVVSQRLVDPRIFILEKKDNGDIAGHIFTKGIALAVSVLVAVVCIVVVCAIYRVDLVLFYRRLTGRDETLTGNRHDNMGISFLKLQLKKQARIY